jgi:hypothetical protein
MTVGELLQAPPEVINIGVADFAESLVAQGAEVIDMRWTPPRKLDTELRDLLERLL